MLNPAAWTDAAPGQFGASAPYYSDFRWQRQPSESMGIGRIFRIKEAYTIQLRAEFTNIFNRMFYAVPSDGAGFLGLNNPATPVGKSNSYGNLSGLLSSGFGYVNWFNGGVGSQEGPQPRSGKIVLRFTF